LSNIGELLSVSPPKEINIAHADFRITPAQLKFTTRGKCKYYQKDISLNLRGYYKFKGDELVVYGDGKLLDEAVDIDVKVSDIRKSPVLRAKLISDIELETISAFVKEALPYKLRERLPLKGSANISCKVEYSHARSKLASETLITLPDTSYSLDAVLKDLQRPLVEAKLTSEDDLSISSIFNIAADKVHIEKMDIVYKGIYTSLIGDVYDFPNTKLNIYGNIGFSLEDLATIASDYSESSGAMPWKGKCKGELYINGLLEEPRLLEIGFKLNSDRISYGEFQARNFVVKMVSKSGRAIFEKIALEPYGGTLDIIAVMDLNKDPMPYEISGHLRNIQIEELVKDTKLKNSRIYGNLNSSMKLAGLWQDPDSIRGEAWIHAKDAHLGPLPIFVPVVSHTVDLFAKLVPGYEKIMLREATGTFNITDRKITTDDFILWGNEASVLYEGYIDFDGNLDFRVENNFVEGLTDEKTDAGRTLSKFLTGMGSILSEARLTGTIKKPKYKFQPVGFDKIFKERFKNVFEGIFR
jgi:hypothetical protein